MPEFSDASIPALLSTVLVDLELVGWVDSMSTVSADVDPVLAAASRLVSNVVEVEVVQLRELSEPLVLSCRATAVALHWELCVKAVDNRAS